MQFNTTQYYLILPISCVEEFIEELENYRQINKDLKFSKFKTSCLYNNPLEDKTKKKKGKYYPTFATQFSTR